MHLICSQFSLSHTTKSDETLCVNFFKFKAHTQKDAITALSSVKPSVYVMHKDNIPNILALNSRFQNLGEKHDNIGLTAYLKRAQPNCIPVLKGNYSNVPIRFRKLYQEKPVKPVKTGKLLKSIKRLLENWESQNISTNPHNAFIMGLDEPLLQKVFKDFKSPYAINLQRVLHG